MEPYKHFTRETAAGMRGKSTGACFDFDALGQAGLREPDVSAEA